MREITSRILAAKRKSFFGSKPMFEPYETVSNNELVMLEKQMVILFPPDLRSWYLDVGFGDINKVLSFRKEWFDDEAMYIVCIFKKI